MEKKVDEMKAINEILENPDIESTSLENVVNRVITISSARVSEGRFGKYALIIDTNGRVFKTISEKAINQIERMIPYLGRFNVTCRVKKDRDGYFFVKP